MKTGAGRIDWMITLLPLTMVIVMSLLFSISGTVESGDQSGPSCAGRYFRNLLSDHRTWNFRHDSFCCWIQIWKHRSWRPG